MLIWFRKNIKNMEILEKEFLEWNKKFIEMNNEIFIKKIKEIAKEENKKIEELIFPEIEDKLEEKLPFMSKKLISFLFHFFEKIDLEEEEIEKIINKKAEFNLLKPNYLENKNTIYEFIKTANSIWIWNELNEKSLDLENNSDEEFSKKNNFNNYKDYIWQKLLLTKDSIKNSSIEELNWKMWNFINFAKQHVFTVMKNFNWNEKDFKSEYFDQIHKINTIFWLMNFFYLLEKKKSEINKRIKKWEKEEVFQNALEQINIWKFEIQRLFALNSLYIDRESTLNHKHVQEEKEFLIWKIKDIWTEDFKKWFLKTSTKVDNELYNYTKKKDFFWRKKEDWKYEISEKEKEWFEKITLDSYEIEWKERRYQKDRESIKIYHIWNRTAKNHFSTVEKFLRKWHNSFNEILDHKWFIFVVNNYKKDWKNLLKILENRLWTLRTSWIEEPEFMSENWNENSNSEYNSLKWILKISYKWKKINSFFKELKQETKNSENKNLKKTIKELWDIFWEKKYFIETELQVFDLESYIKAEIDKTSSAYHWDYKEKQQIKNIPLYFPKEIYWTEKLKKAIKHSLEKLKK